MQGACSSRVFLALDTAKRSFSQSRHAAIVPTTVALFA